MKKTMKRLEKMIDVAGALCVATFLFLRQANEFTTVKFIYVTIPTSCCCPSTGGWPRVLL